MKVERAVMDDFLRRVERGEVAFSPLRPGVEVHYLFAAPAPGPVAAVVRYAPGGEVPRHRHEGHEHVYVLSGSQRDERGVYDAGTLVVNPPGSSHSVSSPHGCLALLFWERPVVFEVPTSANMGGTPIPPSDTER
jgi:anti-sigma factor ChrR (cupin superfamily)